MDPFCEVPFAFGLHSEKAAAEVYQFPGEEEAEPRHAHERRCSRAEHLVAGSTVAVIAVLAETAVAEAPDHKAEGGEAEGGHPQAVGEGVDEEFVGEDAAFQVLGWALEDVACGGFEAETHVGET